MFTTTRPRRNATLLLVAIAAVSLIVYFTRPKSEHSRGEIPAYPVIDLRSGDQRDLGEYTSSKKPTVLWFWTPGCTVCADEIDVLRESTELEANVVAVGSFATNTDARRFFKGRSIGRIQVATTEYDRLVDYFSIDIIPSMIIFNDEGRETARFEGHLEATAISTAMAAV